MLMITVVPLPEETTTSSPPPAPTTTSTTPTPEVVTTISTSSTSTMTVYVTSSSPKPKPETPAPQPETSAPAETPSAPAETPSTPAAAETPSTPAAAETPSTPAEAPTTSSTPAAPTTSSSVAPATSSSPAPELPTPATTKFSSTGVYTIPAKTLTVTDSTTVCGATGTEVPSGTHTVGGVTTSVETATTVTCPYATVKPSGSTSTSVIETTTYACPSAGTYTIAPITTYVPSNIMLVYPTPASYTPGTYTKPEQTMTVTNTDYTYVCPETSSSSAPAAPTTTPAPSSTAPSTTSNTPALSLSVGLSIGASSSATPSPSGLPGQMGMTYSPYSNDGGCKDQDSVMKDVGDIAKKGFSHVRIYSTDCNGLEYVGKAAKQHNLKMIIGVYIDNTGVSGAQKQVDSIKEWAQWDLVTLVVVGNEAIQSGYVDVGSLAGLIKSTKKTFQESGYSGDVTTSEPINIWQQKGKSLCSAIDAVGANIHPFFNTQTTADQAGKFARSEVDILEKICPGKDVLILETGWPSQGNANGAAVPGKAQQATAVKALAKEVGPQSVFFSFANDMWKDAGEFNVERYWGCINEF